MGKYGWCLIMGLVGVIALTGGGDLTTPSAWAQQPPAPRPVPPLPALPDLVAADVGVGRVTDQQGAVWVQFSCFVRNAGTAAAGVFLIEGLIDGTLAQQVYVRGDNPKKLTGLAPAAQVRHTFLVHTKVFSVPGGQYYPGPKHKYTCRVDPRNQVTESNEANNERVQLFTP